VHVQATVAGFGVVNQANVFKVCDSPHPVVIKEILSSCTTTPDLQKALDLCNSLWMDGYSATDIIGTLFRVAKSLELPQHVKLDVIKEVGQYHMRIADGVTTLLQIHGLCSRIFLIATKAP
jgi:replication factor C subunit 2/4